MIGLYFNDANLLTENREEEQYAEAALNSILAGKTADVRRLEEYSTVGRTHIHYKVGKSAFFEFCNATYG